MLAATLTTAVVFFPGDLPLRREPIPVHGAGAGGRAFAVCFLLRRHDGGAAVLRAVSSRSPSRPPPTGSGERSGAQRFNALVQPALHAHARRATSARVSSARCCGRCDRLGIIGSLLLSLALYPLVGKCLLSRAPTPASSSSTSRRPPARRLELTERRVGEGGTDRREVVPPNELKSSSPTSASRPGFSSMYTTNSGPHTAFVQVGLKDDHTLSSYEYMDRVRHALAKRTAAAERLTSRPAAWWTRCSIWACRRRSTSR